MSHRTAMDEGSGNEVDILTGIILFFPDGLQFNNKGTVEFYGLYGCWSSIIHNSPFQPLTDPDFIPKIGAILNIMINFKTYSYFMVMPEAGAGSTAYGSSGAEVITM
jgi:hypothetical protein